MRKALLAFLILPALIFMPGCDSKDKDQGDTHTIQEVGRRELEKERTAERGAADANEAGEAPPRTIEEELNDVEGEVATGIRHIAERADGILQNIAAHSMRAWICLALLVVFGAVLGLYGWTIVKSFMVPFAPVWGLVVGGFTTYFIIQAFRTDLAQYTVLALVGAGMVFGVSLFLFAALRAKPVAALLVVMSPFVMVAAYLFPDESQALTGVIVFGIGFVAGFAAMIEVRPLAIVSTSLLGALNLMAAYGLLANIFATEEGSFLLDSFRWLVAEPWMLLITIAVLTFVGTNFQFSTGPRGTLED